ncbi:MAG: ribonuclease H-like domain-containing protein [Planctomycetales bacterium]|nr:ribonuclease H-like domain-containing protein [Planctomycetales bacterium]
MARPLSAVWPAGREVVDSGVRRLQEAAAAGALADPWPQLAAGLPHRAALLDLETCGFAGSMVFLVGLIHSDGQELTLTQWLARNYAEEPSMLWSLQRQLAECDVLLTFNGKSFDWPMVRDRCVLHRLAAPSEDFAPPHHLDLLHLARRRYRRELPDCRLQTLERYLCGRRRAGDIPGSEIPAAYHRFARTGAMDQMQSVLHHNALDLVTLLQVSLTLAAAAA